MSKNNIRKLNYKNKRDMEEKNMRKFNAKGFMNDTQDMSFEETMNKIANNIEVAKVNLPGILKVFLEICGFDTPSLQDKMFGSFVKELCTSSFIEEWGNCLKLKDKTVIRQSETIANAFQFVMNADNVDIRDFNSKSSEDNKRSLFTQCLSYLLYLIKENGVNGVATLLKIAFETDDETEKERLWLLATMFIQPELAKIVAA